MTRVRAALAGAMLASLLSGCVAAVVPLAAGAVMVKSGLNKKARMRRAERSRVQPATAAALLPTGTVRVASAAEMAAFSQRPTGVAPASAPEGARLASPSEVAAFASGGRALSQPPSMLAGNGRSPEAAALSVQAYQGLWSFLAGRANARKAARAFDSVVLSARGTPMAPAWESCGAKPLAVVVDLDAADGDASAPWRRWETEGVNQVHAAPGAGEVFQSARAAGIAVVYLSNRSESLAGGTATALDGIGLGPVKVGETLWLKNSADGDAKDARRQAIAARFCVVGLVGDRLGDFSDRFDADGQSEAARGNAATESMVGALWGNGWFLLPNAVIPPANLMEK